jgi:DNA-binding NtrC family response regulator
MDTPSALLSSLTQQLIEQTPSLAPLAPRLALAAAHDVTVLLSGETGTGKSHLARLLHAHSPRRGQRLLVVPCGALAPNLLMSEFFGHVRGAFTGADQGKVGKFEAAGGGTLLLDEVDVLPLEAQAGLLRVIETGEFEPVGGNEVRRCQARILAASNWDLEKAVAAGKFRQDLYYRLNVLAFYLPPLRERPEDIAALTRGMVRRFADKFGKALTGIHPETLQALQVAPWPGNIRQLENVLQQAVLVSSGPELLPIHLPDPIRPQGEWSSLLRPVEPSKAAEPDGGEPGTSPIALAESRSESERQLIERALVEAGYSRSRAAVALGISRVTLYKKMKKYGLMGPPSRFIFG